jgi:hypothetical protein
MNTFKRTAKPTENPQESGMSKTPDLQHLHSLLGQARQLAQDEHIMVRVSGERIAVILADLLYEIDSERAEVFSLLPAQRRDA